MPRVSPLPGIHYAVERFADLTDVACPPYDVISEAQRAALLARHERNAVRLEWSPERDPHTAAAETLAAWLADGTLVRRSAPSLYAYRHATAADPDALGVEGIVARVLLEPWGDGVRPHEHTMSGPKADRLGLLRATRTQLSPILAVYFDPAGDPALASRSRTDEWRARDGDGLLHHLSAIEPDPTIIDRLGAQTLYVADGHHRYETALAYQAAVRADPSRARLPAGELAADWIMVMLVNAERSALEIRPTHRVLLDADPNALRALVIGDDPLFQAVPVAPESLSAALEARRDDETPLFGLVLPGDEGWLLIGDADGLADRLRRERMGPAVRALDLASLHVALLADRLGITEADVAAGTRLAYTRDEADARGRVARGEAAAAILVRPTRLDQMAAVAAAGDVMPQKSTYFYPKLLTGMVFNPVSDSRED